MGNPPQEQKEVRQREIAARLHRDGEHAVMTQDDTQIRVYINEDTGPLNVWSGRIDIEPYTIDKVFPLPDEAHFDCWALLKPDWSQLQ